MIDRRTFLKGAALAATGSVLGQAGRRSPLAGTDKLPYVISLAEWSLHRSLFGGRVRHDDFPQIAREQYGIEAVELVNQFFKDKARDSDYLSDFKRRADGFGVKILLIMVDGEGELGHPDTNQRLQAVDNHFKWIEAAKQLQCHSIRVNAATLGQGTFEEQRDRAADGLRRLSEQAARHGLNVLVENHGGLSSNGAWLAAVIKQVGLRNCGTLPDFGNFRIRDGEDYDRYRGVAELMPFARAVSAKSHDFDEHGRELHTDYERMMKIVLEAGYRGYVGIEYEGSRLAEPDGIRATKALLEKVRARLTDGAA
ncbi:MAG: sugar phosphate isomerase/epimerase [Verrucomicrobiales bacterium]|nr:sugar phosphate isomerase/epimerase [Verrucomicrobiales bacterium]MCP5526984.1 sugar phosphate isomerase/epimerase [Verrucomicrobiales bacterium]